MGIRRAGVWTILGIGAGLATFGFIAPRHMRQALPRTKQAVVGGRVPDFSLTDYAGKMHRLSDLRGLWVLLCFLCGCSRCQALAATWEQLHHPEGDAFVLGISAFGTPYIEEFRRTTGTTFPILFDTGYAVAERYGSMECPRCWLINEEGVAVYASRPSDDPRAIIGALEKHLLSDLAG